MNHSSLTSSLSTGSSEVNKYIDQIVHSTNPNILHIRSDNNGIGKIINVLLESYCDMGVEVKLPDTAYYSLPKNPKLVGIEKDGKDRYFIFDDDGYKLNFDTVSAIKLIGDVEKTPIFMRTYGGEDNVCVYHIDTRDVIFEESSDGNLNKY